MAEQSTDILLGQCISWLLKMSYFFVRKNWQHKINLTAGNESALNLRKKNSKNKESIDPLELRRGLVWKTKTTRRPGEWEKSTDILTHFSTIKECNRQTDRQINTDRWMGGIMLAYAAVAYYTPHSKSIHSELPEEKVAITLDFQRVKCEIKLLLSLCCQAT